MSKKNVANRTSINRLPKIILAALCALVVILIVTNMVKIASAIGSVGFMLLLLISGVATVIAVIAAMRNKPIREAAHEACDRVTEALPRREVVEPEVMVHDSLKDLVNLLMTDDELWVLPNAPEGKVWQIDEKGVPVLEDRPLTAEELAAKAQQETEARLAAMVAAAVNAAMDARESKE